VLGLLPEAARGGSVSAMRELLAVHHERRWRPVKLDAGERAVAELDDGSEAWPPHTRGWLDQLSEGAAGGAREEKRSGRDTGHWP
jgi:hypothetical protein